VVNAFGRAGVTSDNINAMITSIEDNTREIYLLMRARSKLTEKVSASLDFLRLSRRYLSRKQIESFARFTSVLENNSTTLGELLVEIATLKSLDAVKKELLHTNTDLNLVYNELNSVLELQQRALFCLEDIQEAGDDLLRLLY
jgi:hypothetical protein